MPLQSNFNNNENEDKMDIKEFIKDRKENGCGYGLYEDYGIFGVDFKPFGELSSHQSIETLTERLESARLGIELDGTRYFFEDLEKYKAFKTKFNLL